MTDVDHVALMSQYVSTPKSNRHGAAVLYSDAIADHTLGKVVDWRAMNTEILKRWSKAGLQYIKERAWKILREPVLPEQEAQQ